MDSVYLDLQQICLSAPQLKLLCVGDIMLDRFVYGRVNRISPEAPIPVLFQTSASSMPGAVGNVARNVASLGAHCQIVSVVGEDDIAKELTEILGSSPELDSSIICSPDRNTTLKVRYISSGQQLLRVDQENTDKLSLQAESELVASILKSAQHANVILLSDYAKGVVTDAVIQACLMASEKYEIPLIVDPKGLNFEKYGAAALIKPNVSELSAYLNMPLGSDEEVETGLQAALKKLHVDAILLTRSEKGLSFLKRGGEIHHFPAEKREVFDVSGAGDTSLAALGIALGSGATLSAAAQFALIASGLAVGKAGTAVVALDEMSAAIRQKQTERREDLSQPIDELVRKWREHGLSVGFTNGCFDILHAGHLSALEFAASHCDRLIVGLNSDASVTRLKGPERPINSEDDRALLLRGLKVVDAVEVFSEDTPLELIRKLQPDVLVKGGDYSPDTIVGADIVQARGGRVVIAPIVEGRSTTNIIEKSRQK